MTRPTDHQIRDLIRKIRRLELPKGEHDWPELQQRLITALHGDASGTDTADGYPTTTLNGGTTTNELTSVEAAASARIAGHRDQLRHHLEQAIGFLDEAARNTGAFANRMNLIDQLIGTPPETRRTCESHARVPGDTTPPEILGTVGGRLTKEADLCRACWDFTRTTGRLPTLEEVTGHALKGRFRLRTAG